MAALMQSVTSHRPTLWSVGKRKSYCTLMRTVNDSRLRTRAEGPRCICTDGIVDTASPRPFAEPCGVNEVPYVNSGKYRNRLLGCLKDTTIIHLCRRPAITRHI